jgi:staphyloferrin B biosynthesis citrate synthase
MPAPGEAMLSNPVKERMKAGEVALGLNVRIAHSGDIARIAKATGHDFIFIDVQNSLFSLETIGHIAQAALGCGVAPLAHVRSCGDPDTSLLLDNGVTGIVFPDVNTSRGQARGRCRQTDIGFLLAAGRWTGDLRAALAQQAG